MNSDSSPPTERGAGPTFPSLYQINTRIWLNEMGKRLGRKATLDDVSDDWFEQTATMGFDWIWLLGVWQTGPAGRAVSLSLPDWRKEFQALLPDLTDDDIVGSPFAVRSYSVHTDFGGDAALERFRARLRQRGKRLLLDFVPNHTALDHAWVFQHPEYYVAGDEEILKREPMNYVRVETRLGQRVLAHGRDPYFPGWADTLQLNYRCRAFRQVMTEELQRIADRCDGVRCDMAMLLLPDVIHRTWENRSLPSDGTPPVDESFWLEAIPKVRERHANFLFMAEVYWDLEWTLQQQGFDYTYDKKLYDRLHAQDAEGVRGHLWATPEFQRHSVRFLENHDEPRAAGAFMLPVHQAAAVVAFLVPGLRFFHEGQFEGRTKRVPVHLGRRADEPINPVIHAFYDKLLDVLRLPLVRDGEWQLLDCRKAWEGNPTWKRFLTFAWRGKGQERLLVTVNYGHTQGQCYVHLPWHDLKGKAILLRDRMSATRYERDGSDLIAKGLYLDVPEWHYQVFDVLME